MIKIFLVTCCFSFFALLKAQEVTAIADTAKPHLTKNAVYVELLGNGLLASVNYERIIRRYEKGAISLRGGFWYYHQIFYVPSFFLPIETNFMWGKKHYIETGLGISGNFYILSKNMYGSHVYLFWRIIGYRYQKNDGGFVFRFGFTPFWKMIEYKNEYLFYPLKNNIKNNIIFMPIWIGMSMGRSF